MNTENTFTNSAGLVMELSLAYKPTGEIDRNGLVDSPDSIVEYMKGAFDERPEQESFWVIPVNTKNRPLGRFMVTLGTATAALVHPREVFRPAIIAGANAIVCVHNHPSGDPAPSKADLDMTRRLVDAGRIIGIVVCDHVVIGTPENDPTGRGRFSFAEQGML